MLKRQHMLFDEGKAVYIASDDDLLFVLPFSNTARIAQTILPNNEIHVSSKRPLLLLGPPKKPANIAKTRIAAVRQKPMARRPSALNSFLTWAPNAMSRVTNKSGETATARKVVKRIFLNAALCALLSSVSIVYINRSAHPTYLYKNLLQIEAKWS
jgi:hypothetical protein